MTLSRSSRADLRIAGWSHTRFGKLEATLEELIVEVTLEAVAHAGLEVSDIDEIILGNFNAGMNALAFPSSLALQASDALHGLPASRVENACASGSAAVHAGARSVLSGTARTVLVIGAEKMTERDARTVGTALLGADYDLAGQQSSNGFAQLFADVADHYAERHGDPSDTLAAIAAKSHARGAMNPLAHLQKPYSAEFCGTVSDKNPIVAGRLRRTDCSPVSDGAAALLLTTADRLSSSAVTPGVRVEGMGQASDFLPSARRDPLAFTSATVSWRRALASSGSRLPDLSFVELHDCFTIAELVLYEALGFAPRGEGARLLDEGTVLAEGSLPVNVSGGLKSKGHPIGATGVSQHIMAAMQLTETAGDLQLRDASRGAVQNMGGLAITSYTSVLARV